MRWPEPSKFPSLLDWPEGPRGPVVVVSVTEEATVVVAESSMERVRNVRNSGAHPATLSRDSELEAGGAYALAAGASVVVWLNEGERLFGRCAAGQSTTLEVV